MAISIGYVTLGAADFEAGVAFYDATFAAIGWKQFMSFPGFAGYSAGGEENGQNIWVCSPFDGQPAKAGNGVMLALRADTRAEVDAFYAAAMAAGGSDEGPPGLRPQYTPTWYAAYLRDPTGNKLAIVCTAEG